MALDVTPLTPARSIVKLAEANRQKLEAVTQQVASGDKYQSFAGYAKEGTLQSMLFLKAGVTEAKGFIKSNETATAKLEVIDQSMENIQSAATELSTLIVNRINGASGQDIPVDIIADSLLDRIGSALNATFNGSYLFGGSKNDRPPVQNVSDSNLLEGEPTASYYQGDSSLAAVRSGIGQEITYGVSAGEEAFRTLIGAAHQLREGHSDDDPEALEHALELVNDAVSQLASRRGVVQRNMDSLASANVSMEDLNLVLEANFNDIQGTDVVEASTRLSELEVSVQASYNAWAQLNKLHLADYIR
jgi:flagellar hook-associated protein 3 FlgL